MQTQVFPDTGNNRPVFLNQGQMRRVLCRHCNRPFMASTDRAEAGSCPHCQVAMGQCSPGTGTIPASPVTRLTSVPALPPPPPQLIAPPVQLERPLQSVALDTPKLKSTLAWVLVGGVCFVAICGLFAVAVVAFVVWQQPAMELPQQQDLVTELHLSDAERTQVEIDETKLSNRALQDGVLKLEADVRTFETELTQLRKSVL